MKILFACGGTAGHINPALTTADTVRRYHPNAKIRFIGNPRGMEKRLVREAGYEFSPVDSKGFYRSLSPSAMAHNVSAVYYMLKAFGTVKKVLDEFRPDIVMGTGGYVSGPVLRCAHKCGYKTVTHEQNAFPGVTTKLLSKYVDKVLLAVPEAQRYLQEGCRCVVVGNPVRAEILSAKKEKSLEELHVKEGRTVLLTFGGSLGAQRINEAVADIIAWHCRTGKIHHIHATGQYGVELLPKLLEERAVKISEFPFLDIREYISDMPRCLAASDIVLCRAGAITLSELQAAGKASILIPSPNVAENHQYHNAMVLSAAGAAIVIEEKELTGKKICDILAGLQADKSKIAALSAAAKKMAITDAGERIYAELMDMLANNSEKHPLP